MKKAQKVEKIFKPTKYLLKYKFMTFFVPFLKALEATTEIIVPFLISLIIDVGIKNNDTKYILTFSLIAISLNIFAISCALLAQHFASITVERMAQDMRRDIFSHINSLSYAELDKFSTAGLMNRTVEDVFQIKNGTGSLLRTTIRIPFLIVGSLVMALTVNAKLSLVFLVISPILLTCVILIISKIGPLLHKSKVLTDKASEITRENLTGVRVVRAFNKQNFEKERFYESNYALVNNELKLGALAAALPSIIYTIVNFAIIAIIYFGAFQINVGGLSQGNLIAFINYFGKISVALVSITRLVSIYVRMNTSSKRINEIFLLKNSITDPEKPIEIDTTNPNFGSVEFVNVSFSYNNIKNVIYDVSIKANPGETIGIIGGTGSGKSSLAYLIPRFYDVSKGSILIGGENIKKYKVNELRQIIGIVPQNPTLFEGTIYSNLCWRKNDATEEELIRALKISQSYDFVKEYPDFLKHKVNRGGTNFSGGQKQRLTIARALVNNPKILILDDSSSALDFATDAKLRKSIKQNLKDTTTFIISQRTNSIKDADKIIVLDNGYVAGIGTHEELLNNCSIYKEIHDSQSKEVS